MNITESKISQGVRFHIYSFKLQRTLSKSKREVVTKTLRRASSSFGMPMVTSGTDLCVYLVPSEMASNNAHKQLLNWMLDAGCFRYVRVANSATLMSLLQSVMCESCNAAHVVAQTEQAKQLFLTIITRLLLLAYAQGFERQALVPMLDTMTQLDLDLVPQPSDAMEEEQGDAKHGADRPWSINALFASLAHAQRASSVCMQIVDTYIRGPWALSDEEVCILFDMPASLLGAWDRFKQIDPPLSHSQLVRISHALNLYEALFNLFGDKGRVAVWMRAANDTPLTGGRSALAYLLECQGEPDAWWDIRQLVASATAW
jgi:hypothetical protein